MDTRIRLRRYTRAWTCERTSDMKRLLSRRWIKAPVFALCLGPLFMLGWRALTDRLGANPIELVTHSTGDWTVRFLLIGLAITPLRKLLGRPELIRFRRM